jgi:hypothetical protein
MGFGWHEAKFLSVQHKSNLSGRLRVFGNCHKHLYLVSTILWHFYLLNIININVLDVFSILEEEENSGNLG